MLEDCRVDELPSLNVCYAVNGSDSFEKQLNYLTSEVINDFDKVRTAEELFAYRKKWIQTEIDYYKRKGWDMEDEDEYWKERMDSDRENKSSVYLM